MMTIEKGDIEIQYTWSAGCSGDWITPGEQAHPEDVTVYYRGRKLQNISDENRQAIEDYIVACHE